MKVSLVITPGAAGPNGFDVDVTDFDSGAPLDATDVSLRFEPVGIAGVGASTLDLMHHGDRWMGNGSQVSIAGVWTITVVVQTASSGTEIPLTLVTSPPGSGRVGLDGGGAAGHLHGRVPRRRAAPARTTIRARRARTSST